MARLTIRPDDITLDAPDKYALFRLDNDHPSSIFFGCRDGSCGRCLVRVVSGADRLGPLGKAEARVLASVGARPDERLACRCVIHDTQGNPDDAIIIETVGPEDIHA